jgi:hypothetical protein
MARKPKDKPVETPEAEERPERKRHKGLITQVRECHKKLVEAPNEQKNRRQAMDDMEFLHIPGKQWDEKTRSKRGSGWGYETRSFRFRACTTSASVTPSASAR